MIDLLTAASECAVLMGLKFAPPPGSAMERHIVEMLAERSQDQAHCRRAVRVVVDSVLQFPAPVEVSEAISQSYQAPLEPTQQPVRCRQCHDNGFYGSWAIQWCRCAATEALKAKQPTYVDDQNREMAGMMAKLPQGTRHRDAQVLGAVRDRRTGGQIVRQGR